MKLVINIQNLTITSFKEQHFCSYLTENMTRVNFKKPKILNYLRKIYIWCKNHENTTPRGKVQRLRILQ